MPGSGGCGSVGVGLLAGVIAGMGVFACAEGGGYRPTTCQRTQTHSHTNMHIHTPTHAHTHTHKYTHAQTHARGRTHKYTDTQGPKEVVKRSRPMSVHPPNHHPSMDPFTHASAHTHTHLGPSNESPEVQTVDALAQSVGSARVDVRVCVCVCSSAQVKV